MLPALAPTARACRRSGHASLALRLGVSAQPEPLARRRSSHSKHAPTERLPTSPQLFLPRLPSCCLLATVLSFTAG